MIVPSVLTIVAVVVFFVVMLKRDNKPAPKDPITHGGGSSETPKENAPVNEQ